MYRVDFLLVLFGGKEGVTRFKVLPVVHPAASAATDGEPGGSRLTVDWSEIIARSALILPSFFPFCSALFLSLESPYCSSTWGRSSYRIKSIICIDRVVDRVREIDRLGEGEMMHSPLSLSQTFLPMKCPPSCCDFHFCGQCNLLAPFFFSPFLLHFIVVSVYSDLSPLTDPP